MSFFKLANRDIPRASCAPSHLGIATGVLVAFLTTFGFADFTFADIIANWRPVAGAPGIFSDPESYSIADINAAGGIIIGDKLFDSFSVTSSSLGAIAPTAASIEITGVDINGDYGFHVNAIWAAWGGESVDTAITFHASVLPESVAQGHAFDGNALYLTAVDGADTTSGGVSISERLYKDYPGEGGPSFAHELAYYRTETNQYPRDTAVFAPITSMWVVKDIGVSGGVGPNGLMHLSEFYETFHQTHVPEPSALMLSGIGVLGFAGFAWRKRR
jgi:hypothetical protein